jgi:hypothetical protein
MFPWHIRGEVDWDESSQNQEDYSLQKSVRRNFKRVKVIVSGPNEQLDVDMADMQSLSKDGWNGLVCLVHILRSNVVELSMRSCIVFFYQLWQNVKIFSGFLTVQISVDLFSVYTNPSQLGAYLGPEKIRRVILGQGHDGPGIFKIRKSSQNQDTNLFGSEIRPQLWWICICTEHCLLIPPDW